MEKNIFLQQLCINAINEYEVYNTVQYEDMTL